MRASWEALHASLERSLRTLKTHQTFLDAKHETPRLARFGDAASVVGFLGEAGQGGASLAHGATFARLDAKDALLSALVRLAQERRHAPLALTLLWLGLWPGLDAVYRRRLRHLASRPEELVADIAHAFTTLVGRLDVTSVRRVAATLVRSTERDVMDARKRFWAEDARARGAHSSIEALSLAQPDTSEDAEAVARWTALEGGSFGTSLTGGGEVDLAALREHIALFVGEDAELVLAVLVLEESQREAAERLGLSYEASRKRFQRALGHLRRAFAPSVSRPAASLCV